MHRTKIILLARVPIMGKGKTRLAKQIGSLKALRLQRLWLSRLCRELSSPLYALHLALTFEHIRNPLAFMPASLPHIKQEKQIQGDLGKRMIHLGQSVTPFHKNLIFIGSDVPNITLCDIKTANHLLNKNDIVLGPTKDGGIWLLGLKRPTHYFLHYALRDIRWSSKYMRDDLLYNVRHKTIAMLDERSDIDDEKTLKDFLLHHNF